MEKRTDRNKALYAKVNKKIEEIHSKRSNKEFEDRTQTLKKVDSAFFSDEEDNTVHVEQKKETVTRINPKILIIGIILFLVVAIGIIITVVSLKWKN